MRRPYSNTVLILTAAVLTACSGDPTDTESDVTEAEAKAMAGALFSLTQATSFDAAANAPDAASGPSAAPITVDTDVAFAAPCPLGGKVGIVASLNGVLDAATGIANLSYHGMETHHGCVAEDPESGTRFTFDGDPSLTVDFEFDFEQNGDFTLVGDYSGRVAWATGEKAGACTIDIDFDAAGNSGNGTGTVTVAGSVCGVEVDATISST